MACLPAFSQSNRPENGGGVGGGGGGGDCSINACHQCDWPYQTGKSAKNRTHTKVMCCYGFIDRLLPH